MRRRDPRKHQPILIIEFAEDLIVAQIISVSYAEPAHAISRVNKLLYNNMALMLPPTCDCTADRRNIPDGRRFPWPS